MGEGYVEPEIVRLKPRRREAFLFLAPALVLLGVFFLYPVVWLVSVSLTEYDPVTSSARTVGAVYYRELLTSPGLWRCILNMAYFSVVYVPLTLAGAALLAWLLDRRVLGSGALRALFAAPAVVPVVGAALIWRAAYEPFGGSLDRLLSQLGYEHGAGWAGWLAQPYLVTPCIALMCVWRDAGLLALIFASALARIPRETYELAQTDGATRWQTFRHVTLPLCSGTATLALVLLVINVQNVFQEIYVMTEDGGPANWSLNIPFLVYRSASYLTHEWGHAAALSVILFAVTVIIILIQNRMLSRRLGWS